MLQWTIRKKDQFNSFVGFEALQRIKKSPPDAKRLGVKLLESGVPREGFALSSESGEALGKLTSGTFSPNLKIGIGMAYLPTSKVKKEGTPLFVDIRGRKVKAVTCKMPFLPPKYYKNPEDKS